MARRANRWTQAEDAQLKLLYENPFSIGEIAVRLDRSPSAVRTRIVNLGLTRTGRTRESEYEELLRKARALGVNLGNLPSMQTAISVALHLATKLVCDTSEIEAACNLKHSNCTKVLAYLDKFGSIFIDKYINPREVTLNRKVYRQSPMASFPKNLFESPEPISSEEFESMLGNRVRSHKHDSEDTERFIAFIVRQYKFALAGDIGFEDFERILFP